MSRACAAERSSLDRRVSAAKLSANVRPVVRLAAPGNVTANDHSYARYASNSELHRHVPDLVCHEWGKLPAEPTCGSAQLRKPRTCRSAR